MSIKIKKWIYVLFMIFAAVSLSCCGNDGGGAAENIPSENDVNLDIPDEEAVETAEEISDGLPEADWNGRAFRILSRACCESHVQEVWQESETGDVIDDAVYKRNRTVEARFNITIEATFPDATVEDYVNTLFERAVKAGDDLWDYALFHHMFGSWSVQKGLCLNWYSLPHINFEQPWWAPWITKAYTIDGKSYLALNDMGTDSITHTSVLFFNKDLVRENSLENPYELVRAGKWTLDKLSDYVKGVARDINGDGIMNENDLYGITGSGGMSFQFMYAADQQVVKLNEENYPEIILNSEKMINIFDKCKALFHGPDSSIGDIYDWGAIFKSKRALVTTGSIGNALRSFRDMETDFGIIPYPKYDEAQENYYTHLNAHGPIMTVPMTISDPEFAGMIIEALAAEGYRTVKPVLIDVALKTKQVRDEDSVEMIDIILEGRRSCFGYPYDGWGMTFILDYMARGHEMDFSSYYERNVKRAQLAYEKVIKQFSEFDY